MSGWKRVATAIASMILAVLVIGGLAIRAQPAAATTPHYDHNSPTHDWGGWTCAQDAQVKSVADVRSSSTHALMASVDLLYSPRCRSWWAQVVRHVDMAQFPHYWFTAAIVRSDGSDIYCQYAEPDGFTGGGCYTAMLVGVTGYQAKGAMFHWSNQNLVAFGETDVLPAGFPTAPGWGWGS